MAKGVSIDLIVDPKKAIEGLDRVEGKASSSSKFLEDLGKTVAGVAVAAAAAIAGAVAGLSAASVAAAQYADDILTAATNTRLSTDTLQAYKYAAELIDTPLETVTKSLSKNIKSMNAARSGTGAAAEAYAALGVTVVESNGELRNSETVFWQTIDALGGMANETERDAIALTLLGKSAADLNSLIAQGSAGFADLTAEARKNGAVMSGEQLDALGSLDDALQRIKSTAEAAKNALGLVLMPQLTILGEEGSALLGEFSSALLATNASADAIGPAAGKLLSGFTDIFIGLVDQAVPTVLSLVGGILEQLPRLIEAGIALVVSLATGIGQALPTLIPSVVKAVVNGILAITAPKNLNAILKAGIDILMGLVNGIITAIPILIGALPQIIVNIITFIVGAIPQLIDAGIQLLVAIVGALPVIISSIVEALPEIIIGITEALIGAIPQLIMAGVQLFVALIANLPMIILEIVKAIPQIIVGMVNAFTSPETMRRMGEAGMQLIRGLWEGISSMGDWLWKQVTGFADGVVGWWNDLWGIKSPSTVFAQIGRYAVQGLEKGLAAPNHLSSIVQSLSDDVTNGFNGTLSVRARGMAQASLAGQQGDVGSFTQNTYQQTFNVPAADPHVTARLTARAMGF